MGQVLRHDLRRFDDDCLDCPLRRQPLFVPMTPDELAFQRGFKTGELQIPIGADILNQGESSGSLYTVLTGMAVRSIMMEDGRRQVISFVFPGDLIGLQSGLMGEARHTVTAVTQMTLCTFPRNRVWDLFQSQPARAYDMTWIAALPGRDGGHSWPARRHPARRLGIGPHLAPPCRGTDAKRRRGAFSLPAA